MIQVQTEYHQPRSITHLDDNIYLKITESMVKKIGYPVLSARGGNQAISVFEKYSEDIACILLDIHMPQMNGVEALQKLRENCANAIVIIVSGYLSRDHKKRLTHLSPVTLLEKPVTYAILSHTLTEYLS